MSNSNGATYGAGLRTLALPVYVPTLLLSLAQGLLLPVLPFYARSFEISFGMAAIVLAAAGIGTMLADVPAGMTIGRLGLKPTMLIGATLVVVSTFALAFASGFPVLVALRFIAGVGTAMWSLSRHAFIAESIHPRERGRAISTFGGINRIGTLGGPALGGFVGSTFGLTSAFYVAGTLALGGMIVAGLFVKSTSVVMTGTHSLRWGIVRDLWHEKRRDLTAAGVAQICGQMIRSGRQTIIPFYAEDILGLTVAEVGLIMTASSIVDVLLFFPAGVIMDRFGRKYTSVPSFAIMGIGMMLIPATNGFFTLMAVAMVIGVGNGLGSGAMQTLGADLAPRGATGEFLGIWRLVGDSGSAGGPLVVGSLTDTVGFGIASFVLGCVGLTSASVFALLVRETRVAEDP
jgi:MFS family permease